MFIKNKLLGVLFNGWLEFKKLVCILFIGEMIIVDGFVLGLAGLIGVGVRFFRNNVKLVFIDLFIFFVVLFLYFVIVKLICFGGVGGFVNCFV